MVGRTIVNKDKLQIWICLFKEAAGATLNEPLNAIDWNEDANLIHTHLGLRTDHLLQCFFRHSANKPQGP